LLGVRGGGGSGRRVNRGGGVGVGCIMSMRRRRGVGMCFWGGDGEDVERGERVEGKGVWRFGVCLLHS
jgi:hypothetical protein